MASLHGSFTGTGTSGSLPLGSGWAGVDGGSGTVVLQVKLGDGTWYDLNEFTADGVFYIQHRGEFRMNCTAYTSGTITYAIDSA